MYKQFNIFKITFLLLTGGMLFFSSCNDKEEDEIKPEPTISEVEIGLGNNGIGIIGRDFHFNAEILAGDKIDSVKLQITQQADESYEAEWSFEIVYAQYQGAKNATVHKHFGIPEEAVEGKYDFLITITDENGTKLEEKRNIIIYNPENLPVDPQLVEFSVLALNEVHRVLYILTLGGYRDPETLEYGNYNVHIDKNETLSAGATISGIKDDGDIYILLINKIHDHRPESIDAIDFSKAIVVDAFQHTNLDQADRWSHINFERPHFPNISKLLIGAEADNNTPPNVISELKAWESDQYYVGVIYENTTHNMGLFHYIEIEINGF